MDTTLANALANGAARLAHLSSVRADAELLLMRAANIDRAFLLTHPDVSLTPEQLATYNQWIERRAQHEPIQYIIGEQEFYGLPLRVTPDVLIPRPETEHLVEAALQRLPHNLPLRIVDVGTGSGAIAIALAHALPQASVTALDTSPAALAVARQNAQRHDVASRIRFLESDLLAAVATEIFDAIVSNPPYVSELEVLEPQVRDYEPHAALFAGRSGLDIYQRLIPQARQCLRPQGWLLMEIGHGQRDALASLLTGWNDIDFVSDLQGIPRVAIARRS
ncbi:MAG TPA: peptide chain release factor N(5)-glutamine methyltransferase [Acidobacteriaceae bacterium]|nr:peptide chain release factor N(5)-glutamine methyltransferase [Acidobacteriaceae bacterium]